MVTKTEFRVGWTFFTCENYPNGLSKVTEVFSGRKPSTSKYIAYNGKTIEGSSSKLVHTFYEIQQETIYVDSKGRKNSCFLTTYNVLPTERPPQLDREFKPFYSVYIGYKVVRKIVLEPYTK